MYTLEQQQYLCLRIYHSNWHKRDNYAWNKRIFDDGNHIFTLMYFAIWFDDLRSKWWKGNQMIQKMLIQLIRTSAWVEKGSNRLIKLCWISTPQSDASSSFFALRKLLLFTLGINSERWTSSYGAKIHNKRCGSEITARRDLFLFKEILRARLINISIHRIITNLLFYEINCSEEKNEY